MPRFVATAMSDDPAEFRRLIRAKEIFLAARAIGLAQREDLIDRECGGDTPLRQLVVELLRGENLPLPFETLADDIRAVHDRRLTGGDPTSPTRGMADARNDDRIGNYRLLERIGEGGFGVVFMAQQERPVQRRVALKIIKLGMDTRQVVARFEAERQALALMDHPGIAKVYDAGATETGRPYFVMELVRGLPITEYCDQHKLGIRDRLALVVQVCEALQHAHQKGVIHRDIKPSNVLVTQSNGAPAVKIIDFGVAKATSARLTERTIYTEFRQMIGTPEYMSPEQAGQASDDVDTRTDVYAAGVLMYELLTGVTPFESVRLRSAAYGEVQRIIREEDPPKPSTRLSMHRETLTTVAAARATPVTRIKGLVRGELDWIVMKALEKDRARRYESVGSMGRDIQRYLGGEGVHAAPASTLYRVRTIIRRNRGLFASVIAVFSVLLLGMATTLWQASNARIAEDEQRRLAEAESKARQKADQKSTEAEAGRQKLLAVNEAIEYNTYVANVRLADAKLRMREFNQVAPLLDACPERWRGWEWKWIRASTDESLTTLAGHTSWVRSAAFSPDGTRIVSGSEGGDAMVWDPSTGTSVALKGHKSLIWSATFSQDGSKVLTASYDGMARLWDAGSGSCLLRLEGHSEPVRSARFSPDAKRVVTSSWDGTARVWDAGKGQTLLILKGHTGDVKFADFSSDGRVIVTASQDCTARLWNAATGETIHVLRGHAHQVQFACFSPDDRRILTVSDDHNGIIWDAKTGENLSTLKGHMLSVRTAAFSSDGARIVTTSDDETARIWDATTGKIVAVLAGHTDWVSSAQFSPDGTRVVTASKDSTCRIWDASTGAPLAELRGHTGAVNSAAFSPDGKQIVTASHDGSVRLWDADPRQVVNRLDHSNGVNGVAFSPDNSKFIASSEDMIATIYDAAAHSVLFTLRGHTQALNSGVFSSDGNKIVTASDDGSIRVWNAATGESLAELNGHHGRVFSAVFNSDGSRILSACEDMTACVCDTGTGFERLRLSGHGARVRAAAFSPDGARIATASEDMTARVWDALTGVSLLELRGHQARVFAASFNADGSRIVTGSGDHTARIWDATTGECVITLNGHTGPIMCASFSPDGTRILTGSEDRVARIWDARTGICVAELKGHLHEIRSAAFSPEGTCIVTGSLDRTARLWNAVPFRERFPGITDVRTKVNALTPVSDRPDPGR